MINLITGRQSDDLQSVVINQAIKTYHDNKEKKTFIIVPNHIKFTTEVKSLKKLTTPDNQQVATHNLQILSFSRLAWYFLRNESVILPQILDDAASTMLLKQIVQEKKEQLLLFKDTEVANGALKQIYEAILSVRQGNLDLEDIDKTNLDEETNRKIHDLRLIYNDFIDALAGKFATKDEMQFLLNKYLAERQSLEGANFYFTDFSHFSLQELLTVQLISKKAANTNLFFKTKNGKISADNKPGNYDYIVQRTIEQLEHFWQDQNLNYATLEYQNTRSKTNKTTLNGIWTKELPPKGQEIGNFVQFVKADSRYAEAYFVARTIYQQVALNNYRYRDFLVLAPNLSEYETYLAPILRQNKIPFFDDLQKQMKYHPLVVIIESLQHLLKNNLLTNDVLALAKSKLLIPSNYEDEIAYQYDLDQLENFVLAHGINHNLWHRKLNDFVDAQVIKLDNATDEIERLENLRKYLISRIDKLLSKLKNASDVQAGVMEFWNFLISNKVSKQLENWRTQAIDRNDLQSAQEPEQVWSTLQQLIKDYLLIAKDFDAEAFLDLLVSGFSEATFSQIPSTLDAVNISELGMVQNFDYKQVFIIGATSSNLPKIQTIPGFLTSENIEKINVGSEEDKYLEDNQKVNNLDQEYQFGNILSLASDKIYLSYPILNTANERLQPSIYYRQLVSLTGNKEFAQHDLPSEDGDALSFITNPQSSLGYLAYMNKNDYAYSHDLLQLTQDKLPKLTKQVLTANEFKNIPLDLDSSLAQELYGKNIETSVSQLEQYYQNSFEYFLNYGLRLRPRFENELDVIQAGNYYHETFDNLVKYLKKRKQNLDDLTSNELNKVLQEIHFNLQVQGRYRQLLDDPFNKYLFRKLDQTTNNVAHFWHRNLSKTTFRPQYSELSFGKGQKVKGLAYEIVDSDGHKHNVNLRGKIDRVDLAKINEHDVVGQVIDYKSSQKNFDMSLFASGISLQMVSYLAVLDQNTNFFTGDKNKQLDVLGAFYQTITRKIKRINDKNLIKTDYSVDPVMEAVKALQYQGILIDDISLLRQIEPGMNLQNKSDLYAKVSLKNDGHFTKTTMVFTNEQINKILAYNDFLINKAAGDILSGKIKLNPYKVGQRTALDYSQYKDIQFFDAMLPENNYHDITSIGSVDELIKYIDEILKKGKTDGRIY
ncbi:ATP-dependent helicase/nuclease subunit B [Lactobacillus colini]|uniref:ATP-dependent helicase/nuclease subunit B n=1 Tax=Lactobacillus colini TaxID=1819254 RepID=A0ABS4MBM5_9LACO|nr:PD-(D/E)XK nuclease family protein [Lactobacillus colini]MBP2057078.1 ATP-dependent helicase/nuclease subunit B [Lactobacillus colini]